MHRTPKKGSSTAPEHFELPEDEQWRLINEAGILNKFPVASDEDDDEDTPLEEEIFNAITLIIPFSFLLLMMDMCASFHCP
jgi:hypothetical protein